MGPLGAALDAFKTFVLDTAHLEFSTLLGRLNAFLLIMITVTYIMRPTALRVWNSLMWAVERKFGSAPEPSTRRPARLSMLHLFLMVFGGLYLCVFTIGMASDVR